MNQSTNEKGHFFNEQQKEAKGKIMVALLETFFDHLMKNKELFKDAQLISDLFGSILVMFNREIICHLLKSFGLYHERKIIMKNLFDSIKEEVNRQIKSETH